MFLLEAEVGSERKEPLVKSQKTGNVFVSFGSRDWAHLKRRGLIAKSCLGAK